MDTEREYDFDADEAEDELPLDEESTTEASGDPLLDETPSPLLHPF